MPKKKTVEPQERPKYIDADGSVDLSKLFTLQPKQEELLRNVNRNGGTYRQLVARECMSCGGIRSGKTQGALWHGLVDYAFRFSGCDILVLRKTFKELESGAIADMKALLPKELYHWDDQKHVATLHNGSRIVFGHCHVEKDIVQYLGQAFAFILIDECGQFSSDVWEMLKMRNTISVNCQPDEHGNFPVPAMWGLTNPIGPHFEYYKTIFVRKEPFVKSDTAKKDANGRWWEKEGGEYRLTYDPNEYTYQISTVLDNPALLARDPSILSRLNSLPKAKRDKMLLGLMDKVEGQFFDCWSLEHHVINLREDPDAIVFQDHQDCWASGDWGVGHATAFYMFTKAQVKNPLTGEYKTKTVCFREIISTTGQTYKEITSLLVANAKLPSGKPIKLKAIYFSHEKFSRQLDAHSPAEEFSRYLKQYGFPGLTRGTTDRVNSISYVYNQLKDGQLVILDNCTGIIQAIPSRQRSPINLDDILKQNDKGDDCIDGFRLGLYGERREKVRPEFDKVLDHARGLDPMAKFFYLQRKQNEMKTKNQMWDDCQVPVWQAQQ